MPPNRPIRLEPSPALAELLARDGELDRILDGRGLTFDNPPAPPAPPPQSFFIPKPDWDQEERERLARERQARIAEAAALLESEHPPGKPTAPAPKARRSREAA